MTKAYLVGFICGVMKLDPEQNNPWKQSSYFNNDTENEEFAKGYYEAQTSYGGLTNIMELAK